MNREEIKNNLLAFTQHLEAVHAVGQLILHYTNRQMTEERDLYRRAMEVLDEIDYQKFNDFHEWYQSSWENLLQDAELGPLFVAYSQAKIKVVNFNETWSDYELLSKTELNEA